MHLHIPPPGSSQLQVGVRVNQLIKQNEPELIIVEQAPSTTQPSNILLLPVICRRAVPVRTPLAC
jgi:hypothetical protein